MLMASLMCCADLPGCCAKLLLRKALVSPTEQVSYGLAFAVAARNYGPILAGRCIRRGAARGHRDSQTIRDRLIDRHCLTPMLLFAAGSFALAFACMRQTASMSVTADSTIAPLKVGGSLRGVHPQGASRRVALMGIIEAIPRKDQRAMADGKHEDKKPEITRPTEVIGEHKTEPTTAPTTAHPASVRPGAGPVHFDCVEPTPAAAPPIASTLEPSADATAATTPTPGASGRTATC
jgi:hypothetical protein